MELCLSRPERPVQVVHCPSACRTLHTPLRGGSWEPALSPRQLNCATCARAGDGRYLLSNAKDQTAKLWDLRRMRNAAQHARLPPARLHNFEWDYRCGRPSPARPAAPPRPGSAACPGAARPGLPAWPAPRRRVT